MSFFQYILIVALLWCITETRISPKFDDSIYKVIGCVPGKFHTCAINDIFVLPDEATILSIVNINNAGPWSLPTSYLEIMYRNGSTIKLSTEVIGDTSGQCTFGAQFIPYYNNNQGNAVVLMCSSFSFPGGDTLFFRFKIDVLTSVITPIGDPLIFHSENSFALFTSRPTTAANDVYFLLNSYPSGSNNYSVGVLNLDDFKFQTWSVVLPSQSPFFLNAHLGTFSNAAQVDQLLFSVGCGPHDASYTSEMLCTFKYSNEKEFTLVGMNSIPNAQTNRNLYLYAPNEQQWGITITGDSTNWTVSIMNTQFTAPTNSSSEVIYGATFNDADVILTYTISASISTLKDRCFYLATASTRNNLLVIQQLRFGEDFKTTPSKLVDSTAISNMPSMYTTTKLFLTKNYLFVSEELNIYRYAVEC
ncbi:unnamed protein product [Adineta steineri]|uniref:CUB-like domain-containing protein n=1 Tax=Adineta steineri TaxID=433720 RepID=A0A819D8R5_9BILA|nr:unnamed protein product [Adineta steineri]CAF3819730.1 unnamed protein product [Adineta steineri]